MDYQVLHEPVLTNFHVIIADTTLYNTGIYVSGHDLLIYFPEWRGPRKTNWDFLHMVSQVHQGVFQSSWNYLKFVFSYRDIETYM